jgi:hypothetical protein
MYYRHRMSIHCAQCFQPAGLCPNWSGWFRTPTPSQSQATIQCGCGERLDVDINPTIGIGEGKLNYLKCICCDLTAIVSALKLKSQQVLQFHKMNNISLCPPSSPSPPSSSVCNLNPPKLIKILTQLPPIQEEHIDAPEPEPKQEQKFKQSEWITI